MAEHNTVVKLSGISRIKLYINQDKLPLREIVGRERPFVACTGVFYTGAWKPTCHLKADGAVLADDPSYQPPGFAWDVGPDIHAVTVPAPDAQNYLSCCLLIHNGKPETKLYYNSDVGGRRGRVAVWLRSGELGVTAFPDGGGGMTPEGLRDYLVREIKPDTAIMMDGGGKVNFYDAASGTVIQGREPSQNLLLIYRDENNEEDEPMDGITQRMMTKNPCYTSGRTITPKGVMVHATAAPGVMAQALAKSWDTPTAQAAAHAIVDDTVTLQTLPWTARGGHAGSQVGTANGTHIAFEICEPQECRLLPEEWEPLKRGATGWAVERLQRELTARGYDPKGIDGSFGPGCDTALRSCQKDLGLEVDGSCGPATLSALADREGSYLAYDPAETRSYFEAAWGRAVALAAHLCETYGLDPMTYVLDHSEGHALGIASNHADVGHWFPRHGKSMDDFRAAVKIALAGEDVSELDTAVDKLSAAGLIDSPDYWKGGNYSTANVKQLLIKWAASI